MEEDKQTMDDVSRFRITGAIIWLLLLIVIVPTWYSNPVNFKPESERPTDAKSDSPVVYQAYVLPTKPMVQTESRDEPAQPENQSPNPIKAPSVVVESSRQVAESSLLDKSSEPELKASSAKPPSVKAPKVVAPVEPAPRVKVGQWLVMVYATKEIKDANKVLGQLDDKYEVWIKEFPKSKTFSVRTGPYSSRALAEKDKIKIDKAIRTQSKIVQVK